MKRISLRLATALMMAALAAALIATAATATDTRREGPPCANFVSGDAGYSFNPSTTSGTVTLDMTLAAPACEGATFTLDIYNFAGTAVLVENVQGTVVSGTFVTFSHTFSNAPSDGVCLDADSVLRGRVADSAPDSGCIPVASGSSGGQSGWS